MNILWHSNAPWTPSGYGQQTNLFCPRIKALGHDMSISAYFGLAGAVLNGPDNIKMYPKHYDDYGNDVVIAHATEAKADVLLTLMDVQVLTIEGWPFNCHWVPWYPIDHDTMPMIIRNKVMQAWRRIVFSKHAERLTHEAGLECYYVPHGVNTKVFKPKDKAEARERLGLPKDAYIIGTVAMNKGVPSRKSFVEMITAFANCKKRHPSMVYLLQTATGEGVNWMINLPELCYSLGLKVGTDVIFCDQYQMVTGFPPEYMADLYASMDVHLLASLGEGFGIPTLEAQACGTPVIVGDWTASPELCFSGRLIPKEDADALYTPMAAYQYRPRVRGIEIQIEAEYKKPSPPGPAVKGAALYDVDYVTENYWKPTLDSLQEAVNADARG